MLSSLLKKNDPGVKAGPAKHGQGLFATRRFRKGQVIAEVPGRVIDDPDYTSNYCIDLGGTCSLEPDAPYRFVNHCCEPNCKLYLIYEDEKQPPAQRKVVIEALKNIQPGVELLIDYEWPADGAIPCGCGAAACRGWIVDPAELHQLTGRKPR